MDRRFWRIKDREHHLVMNLKKTENIEKVRIKILQENKLTSRFKEIIVECTSEFDSTKF